MTARVVAFINYKGGVAKTTTTYHIGCSLAQQYHKKVLLVDIDPQTNLTFLCSTIDEWEKFKTKTGTIATMYQRFIEKKAPDTNDTSGVNPWAPHLKGAYQISISFPAT
jgi:chromosome partitioning protein